jgi:hypothetical protein
LFSRIVSHFDRSFVFFGLLAVAAFWFGIRLCWSMSGKRWYNALARLLGALVLFTLGVVLIFFAAFGY